LKERARVGCNTLISHPLTHPLPLKGERGIEFIDGKYLGEAGSSPRCKLIQKTCQ